MSADVFRQIHELPDIASARKIATGNRDVKMTEVTELSFRELNHRIETAPDVSANQVRRPRLARWCLIIGAIAALVGFACQWLPVAPSTMLASMAFFLVIELVSLGTHFFLTWSATFSRTPLRDFADELDKGSLTFVDIMTWLKAQPLDALARHAAVARYRKERIEQRMPLVFGSIQSLGLLPVLIAVYLQVHEITAGRHLGLAEVVVGSAIAGLYYGAWSTSLLKVRLDSMDAFLQAALLEVSAEGGESVVG